MRANKPRSSLLQAIELTTLRRQVTATTSWTQAQPTEWIAVRRADLDLFLARLRVLEPVVRQEPILGNRERITVIMQAVASAYMVTPDCLLRRSRKPQFSWPRQVAMHFSRCLTQSSNGEIADVMGLRTGSSVSHGSRRVQDRIDTEPETAEALTKLQARISAQLNGIGS